jgi:hypothetical protein
VTALANTSVRHTTAARPERARAGVLRADVIAVAGVALVSVALIALTWNRWGDLWLDSGYDLVAASKVSHANAPYIDYDYWYGPLGPMVLGAVYELFGIGIGQAVGLGLLIACGAIGLGYAVARQLVAPAGAAIVAVLAAVPAFSNSNVSFVQPHTYGATLGMLLCLVSVLVVARFAVTGSRGLLVALGVLIGLTALTRHECFGALAFAAGVWLLVRVARSTERRRAAVELAVVVGTAAVIGLGGYGAFLVAGQVHGELTLGELVHQDLFPRGLIRDSITVVFDQLAPRTPASFAKAVGMVVLYAGGVGVLLLGARAIDAGGRPRRVALCLLAVAALVLAGVLAARPDTVRFYLKYVFAWIPVGSILIGGLLVWRAARRRGEAWDRADQVALLVVLMLVGFSYSVYASYWPYPNPDYPQETAYAMAVIGTFLAWFHLRALPAGGIARATTVRALGTGWLAALAIICVVLLVHDSRTEPFAVHGVNGTMNATAVDGPTLQKAVDIIQQRTQRSEPILLAPQMTSLYVLTGRTDPLRQLSLLPGALDGPADEDAAIKTMDYAGVRLVITDRTPLVRYETGAFGTGYARRVGAWLRNNFDHITTLRGSGSAGTQPRTLDVWLRRNQ